MKYCTKCGNQLVDEAVACMKCGCATGNFFPKAGGTAETSNLKLAAKIFMILGTVLMSFLFLFPLAWCVPMTVSYFRKVKYGEPISIGFKICCLIFVSPISGILMLCDDE